jgi:hypothetical protein
VLRFNNHDVMANKAGVLETIASALAGPKGPLPNPPPQAGEGARQLPSRGAPQSRGEEAP